MNLPSFFLDLPPCVHIYLLLRQRRSLFLFINWFCLNRLTCVIPLLAYAFLCLPLSLTLFLLSFRTLAVFL